MMNMREDYLIHNIVLLVPIVLFALGFYLLALSLDNLNTISCIVPWIKGDDPSLTGYFVPIVPS